MRFQNDAKAIDLRAADLERVVLKNAQRFVSERARYTGRGSSLGLVGSGSTLCQHGHRDRQAITAHPMGMRWVTATSPMTEPRTAGTSWLLPLLGLSATWHSNQPCSGWDAITG